LLAIWNGTSPGTRNMIETMKRMNKRVFVFTRKVDANLDDIKL
jgi:hypothetical protein